MGQDTSKTRKYLFNNDGWSQRSSKTWIIFECGKVLNIIRSLRLNFKEIPERRWWKQRFSAVNLKTRYFWSCITHSNLFECLFWFELRLQSLNISNQINSKSKLQFLWEDWQKPAKSL